MSQTRDYPARFYRWLSPDEYTGGPVSACGPPDPTPPGALPYAEILNPQSLNKYQYAYNNPLRYNDPTGHLPWWLLAEYLIDAAGLSYDVHLLRTEPSWGNVGLFSVDIGLALAPGIPTTGAVRLAVKSADKAADLAKNTARGKATEMAVLDAEGLAKNTDAIEAIDPKTGELGATIPDAFRESGQTVEVKDVKRVADSPQLRRQSEISKKAGQKAQVLITERTKQVSKAVERRMDV